MTDWQTLSILRTSKWIHLEASDILYADSHFRISVDWFSQSCDLGVAEKRMRNVTLEMCYSEMSLLESELPPLNADVYYLPGREIAFHSFAKICDTEKVLKRVVCCVEVDEDTVQSTEDGELEHLKKLGHRLTRFSGVREIIVKLAYCLIERLWWPGEEPKLPATPLLKHLKPLFVSYTEDMDASVDQMHVQCFIFRNPTPSQERSLITGQDSNTTIDGEENLA